MNTVFRREGQFFLACGGLVFHLLRSYLEVQVCSFVIKELYPREEFMSRDTELLAAGRQFCDTILALGGRNEEVWRLAVGTAKNQKHDTRRPDGNDRFRLGGYLKSNQ